MESALADVIIENRGCQGGVNKLLTREERGLTNPDFMLTLFIYDLTCSSRAEVNHMASFLVKKAVCFYFGNCPVYLNDSCISTFISLHI